MRRILLLPLGLAVALPVLAATPTPSQSTHLAPEPRQVLIGRTAVAVAQKRHYPAEELNAKLAKTILDQYLDSLDPGRFYFTQADIAGFHKKYDDKLPGDLKHGNLNPAFAIYHLYVKRVRQQVHYALGLLHDKPDFNGDGSYRFERRHAPRAANDKALHQLWREEFDNEALTQMLAGKKWPAAVKVLERRYKQTLRYVDQSTSTDVFSTYMNAYMQALDPHSTYFSPFQEQQFQIEMSLQLQGIGAQLTSRDGYVTVVRILPGGPAAKSGELKPGDRITGVAQGKDGKMEDVVGWRLDDVVKKIRGKKGSTVRLRILPAGAVPGSNEKTLTFVRNTIELEAERAHAHIALVRHGSVAYRIGIIDIPSFYANFGPGNSANSPTVTSDVRALIKKLKQQKVSGILLDLRDNGGGSLQQAAALTGLFIPDGPVVQVKDRGGQVQSLDTPNSENPVWRGPLALLVNRFSASATEIFAGAMKDYQRALILGSGTWGKGTVQTLVPLSDYLPGFKAGEVKLTMAQFFRVSGSSTQRRGVQPDLAIPSPINDSEFGEDSYPNALPWKSIAAADYKPLTSDAVNKMLPKLQKYFKDTVQKTPYYKLFEQQVAMHRKMAARTSVPLNLAKRKAERSEHRKRELAMDNAWRKLAGKAPFKTLEAADHSSFSAPDVPLQASSRILGDYIHRAPSIAAHFKSQIHVLPPKDVIKCLKETSGSPSSAFCIQGGNSKNGGTISLPSPAGTSGG